MNPNEMPSWTKHDVYDWLLNNGIPQDVGNIFLDKNVNGLALSVIDQDDMKDFNIDRLMAKQILELRKKTLKKT